MIIEITNAIFEHGMRWKASELFYVHAGCDHSVIPDDQIHFSDGIDNFCVPRVFFNLRVGIST